MPLPSLDSLESIIAIIIVFGLLVFIHELGHFLLAKRAGILCREFALGMGPKVFSIKRGETEYTIRLLPIGGLVRMAGEDPELEVLKRHATVAIKQATDGKVTHIFIQPDQARGSGVIQGVVQQFDLEHELTITLDIAGEEQTFQVHPQAQLVVDNQEIQIAPYDRQFRGKTVGQRFWTIFAGPAANFLLAFVLLAMLGLIYGVPTNEPVLGQVLDNGPAARAGLQEGDRVLAIDGNQVDSWKSLVQVIQQSPGQQLLFDIERDGQRQQIPVVVEEQENVGRIQVANPVTHSFWAAAKYGGQLTYEFTRLLFSGLAMLFTGSVGLEELSGPVGIFKITGEAAQQGFATLIRWAALLSLNLGIFNLLPIPALDGGRLVFIGVEALRGRPIDPNKEGLVHFVGFAFLMLLILVVTWNDIQRFFF